MPEFPSLVCGVDPGNSGGIAVISTQNVYPFVEAHAAPDTERDVCDLFESYRSAIVMCYIEAVHSFPGQGVASSFTFGQNYGTLRGLLIGLKIPFTSVSPMKWKKSMGLTKGKDESNTDYKNRSKALAQQLWPSLRITHATSEALLLAEYGRREQ